MRMTEPLSGWTRFIRAGTSIRLWIGQRLIAVLLDSISILTSSTTLKSRFSDRWCRFSCTIWLDLDSPIVKGIGLDEREHQFLESWKWSRLSMYVKQKACDRVPLPFFYVMGLQDIIRYYHAPGANICFRKMVNNHNTLRLRDDMVSVLLRTGVRIEKPHDETSSGSINNYPIFRY